jgi:hypothetical protein
MENVPCQKAELIEDFSWPDDQALCKRCGTQPAQLGNMRRAIQPFPDVAPVHRRESRLIDVPR